MATSEVECRVGDLNPGDRFLDQEGDEFIVADGKQIVNLRTGEAACFNDVLERTQVGQVEVCSLYRGDIELGRDRQGRLYVGSCNRS
jgi:hypothetical protein